MRELEIPVPERLFSSLFWVSANVVFDREPRDPTAQEISPTHAAVLTPTDTAIHPPACKGVNHVQPQPPCPQPYPPKRHCRRIAAFAPHMGAAQSGLAGIIRGAEFQPAARDNHAAAIAACRPRSLVKQGGYGCLKLGYLINVAISLLLDAYMYMKIMRLKTMAYRLALQSIMGATLRRDAFRVLYMPSLSAICRLSHGLVLVS